MLAGHNPPRFVALLRRSKARTHRVDTDPHLVPLPESTESWGTIGEIQGPIAIQWVP